MFNLKDFAQGSPTLEGVADGTTGQNIQRVLDGISGIKGTADTVINAFGTRSNGVARTEPLPVAAQVSAAAGGIPWGIIAAVVAAIALVYFVVLKK